MLCRISPRAVVSPKALGCLELQYPSRTAATRDVHAISTSFFLTERCRRLIGRKRGVCRGFAESKAEIHDRRGEGDFS